MLSGLLVMQHDVISSGELKVNIQRVTFIMRNASPHLPHQMGKKNKNSINFLLELVQQCAPIYYSLVWAVIIGNKEQNQTI